MSSRIRTYSFAYELARISLFKDSTLTVIMQLYLSNDGETYIFKKIENNSLRTKCKILLLSFFFYLTLFIPFSIINLYDEIAFIYKVL